MERSGNSSKPYDWRWVAEHLVNEDGTSRLNPDDNAAEYASVLREFRDGGKVKQWFFDAPLPGQNPDPDEAWYWGPAPGDVDWTGLDEYISELLTRHVTLTIQSDDHVLWTVHELDETDQVGPGVTTEVIAPGIWERTKTEGSPQREPNTEET